MMPAPQVARPIGAISEQMEVLDERTVVLHQTISELEGRCQTILSPAPPATEGKAGAQPDPIQLGASLGQMNDRLTHAIQRLRGIIDRVEL